MTEPQNDPWAKRPDAGPPPAADAPYSPPGYPQGGDTQPGYPPAQYGAPGFGQPPGQTADGLPVGFNGLVVPQALPLASRGLRFGAYLLSILLAIVTLGIGYLIWALILWQKGKSPSKQILGMTVVDAQTGRPATWGHMFVRQFLVAGLLFGLINAVIPIFGIIAGAFIFSDGNRTLWDRMAKTYVVKDPA